MSTKTTKKMSTIKSLQELLTRKLARIQKNSMIHQLTGSDSND